MDPCSKHYPTEQSTDHNPIYPGAGSMPAQIPGKNPQITEPTEDPVTAL